MPYIKLYSSDMSVQQKRLIAQRLTEITLRTLQLRVEQRRLISIQFVPTPEEFASDDSAPVAAKSELAIEVLGHNLTAMKRRAFTQEVTAALPELVSAKKGSWLGRLMHHEVNPAKQVVVQFKDMVVEGARGSFDQQERMAA